jgi:Glycosyl transferase family 2/Bifunctional DNA primase/polymerase, N-terminal
MPSLFESALAYTKAGISIIPISPNGRAELDASKSLPYDCSEYIQRRIATSEELGHWFSRGGAMGLAAVLGPISGGLECLDLVSAAAVKLFGQLMTMQHGPGLLERLPVVQGRCTRRTRLYYRCSHPARGYRRLAQFEAPSEFGVVKLEVVAFLHGEGRWTALPGSPAACGDLNETYDWCSRDLTEVPTITEDERHLLLESASCLNGWVDPRTVITSESPEGFERTMSWEEILLPLGWKRIREFGEAAVWHSSGRTNPGYCAVSGIGLDRDLLYVIRTGQAFTKFGAFAWFHFGGHFEKARSACLRSPPPSRWETLRGRRYLIAIKEAQPLISCIMPTTADRGHFLPQAIKCFQQQTYPNLELVIVCDGEDDMSDLIPHDDERIRYFFLGRDRRTLGPKLNLGCERAKGELIAHFDDDDWSHPDRLSFQVGALLAEGAEICGISQLLFFEIGTGEVWLCRTPALLHPSLYTHLPFGASYLYRRSYWTNSPFSDLRLGSDWAFTCADGRQDRSVLVSDDRLCVAMIHSSNTTKYSQKFSYWTPWQGDLREVMGDDLDFYLSLNAKPS